MNTAVRLLSDVELESSNFIQHREPVRRFLADQEITLLNPASAIVHLAVPDFLSGVRSQEKDANTTALPTVLALIDSGDFTKIAESLSGLKPSEESLSTARAFIAHLPENAPSPKLASDEDGDILLVWNEPTMTVVTVEPGLIHVLSMSDDGVEDRLDDVQYDNGDVPVEVARILPVG